MPVKYSDRKVVTFAGSVGPASQVTLVSQRISTPFMIRRIAAYFALNTNRTLQLSFFISPDDAAPTSGRPSGFDILAEYGQVNYWVGDDILKDFSCEAASLSSPAFLKVVAANSDAFDHTIDVVIEIEIFARG